MRHRLKTALLAAIVFPVFNPAFAQSGDPQAGPALSGSLTLTSQYIARGFRQTWGKPAIQGGIEHTHPSGMVSGIWASSVSDNLIREASSEWNVYTGWTQHSGKFNFGALIYYYIYPGAKSTPDTGSTRFDYGEIVPQIGYGAVSLSYHLTYTRDYFGANSVTYGGPPGRHSRGSGYFNLSFNQDLHDGWAVNAHYGYQRIRNFSEANFHDAKFGISKQIGSDWNAELAWTSAWDKDDYYRFSSNGDPAAPVSDPTKSTIVLSITKAL